MWSILFRIGIAVAFCAGAYIGFTDGRSTQERITNLSTLGRHINLMADDDNNFYLVYKCGDIETAYAVEPPSVKYSKNTKKLGIGDAPISLIMKLQEPTKAFAAATITTGAISAFKGLAKENEEGRKDSWASLAGTIIGAATGYIAGYYAAEMTDPKCDTEERLTWLSKDESWRSIVAEIESNAADMGLRDQGEGNTKPRDFAKFDRFKLTNQSISYIFSTNQITKFDKLTEPSKNFDSTMILGLLKSIFLSIIIFIGCIILWISIKFSAIFINILSPIAKYVVKYFEKIKGT